jgi:branched-chain amino acid transport system permease protein
MTVIATRIERMSAERRRTLVAGVFVLVFTLVICWLSWAGRPITFDSILFWLIVGITYGSVYAVAATGLVVTYTTSGIFNFAQGAIGMFLTFVFWQLRVDWGIQTFVAFLLTVLVAAPIMGALIERMFMRAVSDAPLVAQLVTTVGLLLALIGLAGLVWDPSESRHIDRFFGTDGFQIGATLMPWSRFITIVVGLGLALGLKVLLSRTRLGVAMRAVVDNRELAALNGIRPGLVSMFSWSLGSSMAAVASIFLAEELSVLDVETLTLLILSAFAAAIIGRLKSLPLTFAGGLLIGLVFQFQQNFLSWSGRWTGAAFAIPQIMLFLALLFLPQARIEGKKAIREIAPKIPKLRTAAFGMFLVFVAVLLLCLVWGRVNVRTLTLALCTMLIMASMIPLTGWSKQVSLAQITFVGAGAFGYLQWAPSLGTFGGLAVASLFAVPFGVAMALPALRLQGLYLALASMAFAQMAVILFFPQPEIFGAEGKPIRPVHILGADLSQPFDVLGVHFGQDVGTALFIAGALGVVGVFMVWLHGTTFGRRVTALGDSPAACATLGVNPIVTKLGVFAVSAALAGFAGALLGVFQGTATTQDFQMLAGLAYLLLLVVGGVAVVSGAVLGGAFLTLFTWLPTQLPSWAWLQTGATWWSRLGPGLASIGIGRQPSGIVPTAGEERRAAKARRQAKHDVAAGAAPSTRGSELPPSSLAEATETTVGSSTSPS